MLELRCTHLADGKGEGHWLARIESGTLVLFCWRCKVEERFSLHDIVKEYVNEANETARMMNGEEGRLMW